MNLFRIVAILTSLFVMSCSKDNLNPACDSINLSQLNDEQALFYDLAFKEEFGDDSERLRKWDDDINYVIVGQLDSPLLLELNLVIDEINQTSANLRLVEVNTQQEADLIIFFGTKEEYIAEVKPQAEGLAEGNRGFTSIAWDNDFRIVSASVCIDNVNFTQFEDLQHVLREELAQSLGLINDTELNDTSIFHQFIQNQSYSDQDLQIIGEMLSNNLEPGMCPDEAIMVFQ